jgi:2-C-methyl-D-erythritol 4-phosphate cytidylyltransferase/2-C-methyl-D-erythritol 2,4-cyclodiphosphate synthase
MSGRTAAIIAAAGSGERFGADIPKALIQLLDRTLIEHAVAALAPVVDEIFITAPAGFEDQIRALVGSDITVVTGGKTRSESIAIAVKAISHETEFVLVHDAARALASSDLARSVLSALASGEKCVIPVLPEVDTVKVISSDGFVQSTPDRSSLAKVQTPQGFSFATLLAAHKDGATATDDAALVEAMGVKVKTVSGEERALKITTPNDLHQALYFLTGSKTLRTGVGVDAHKFGSADRQLWLGTLLWPNEIGMDGHSDGDVAAHAICDALFAAAQLGDLGSNFGVDRPEYAGASGEKLLTEAVSKVSAAGFAISNISLQIIGNRPKIGSRRAEVIAALSKVLGGVPVSVSATTTDGMGLTGTGEGIAAIASALIYAR